MITRLYGDEVNVLGYIGVPIRPHRLALCQELRCKATQFMKQISAIWLRFWMILMKRKQLNVIT